jgi:hypothetical protein
MATRMLAAATAAVKALVEAPVVAQAPRREDVIERLILDSGLVGRPLGRDGAEVLIGLWTRCREDADTRTRPQGRRVETMVLDHEYTAAHHVMDLLMPDHTVGVPGSVAWMLDGLTFGVDERGVPLRQVMHTRDSTDGCVAVVVAVTN